MNSPESCLRVSLCHHGPTDYQICNCLRYAFLPVFGQHAVVCGPHYDYFRWDPRVRARSSPRADRRRTRSSQKPRCSIRATSKVNFGSRTTGATLGFGRTYLRDVRASEHDARQFGEGHNVDRSNFSFEEVNIAEHLPNGIDDVGQC